MRARQPKPSSTLKTLLHGPSVRKQNSETAFIFNFGVQQPSSENQPLERGEDFADDAEWEVVEGTQPSGAGLRYQATPVSE